MTVKILSTKYRIFFRSPEQDESLNDCDGYCDKSTKTIVVTKKNIDLGDFETHQKQCLRHEIIHAFMFESGLSTNWEHAEFGQEETVVDWIAIQFPKILKVFKKVGAL